MSDLITVPREEWNELKDLVHDIYRTLKAKPTQREWVKRTEFMELTGKTLRQVRYLEQLKPEMRRERVGEGVQINWKLYKETYCK